MTSFDCTQPTLLPRSARPASVRFQSRNPPRARLALPTVALGAAPRVPPAKPRTQRCRASTAARPRVGVTPTSDHGAEVPDTTHRLSGCPTWLRALGLLAQVGGSGQPRGEPVAVEHPQSERTLLWIRTRRLAAIPGDVGACTRRRTRIASLWGQSLLAHRGPRGLHSGGDAGGRLQPTALVPGDPVKAFTICSAGTCLYLCSLVSRGYGVVSRL